MTDVDGTSIGGGNALLNHFVFGRIACAFARRANPVAPEPSAQPSLLPTDPLGEDPQ